MWLLLTSAKLLAFSSEKSTLNLTLCTSQLCSLHNGRQRIFCREEWLIWMLFYFLKHMQTKQPLNADKKTALIQQLWHTAGHKSRAGEKVKRELGEDRGKEKEIKEQIFLKGTPKKTKANECFYLVWSRGPHEFVFWFLFDPGLHTNKGLSVHIRAVSQFTRNWAVK